MAAVASLDPSHVSATDLSVALRLPSPMHSWFRKSRSQDPRHFKERVLISYSSSMADCLWMLRNKSHWTSNKLLPIRYKVKPHITEPSFFSPSCPTSPPRTYFEQLRQLLHQHNSTSWMHYTSFERNAMQLAILRSAKERLQGRRLRAWSHGRRGVLQPSTLSTSYGFLSPPSQAGKAWPWLS